MEASDRVRGDEANLRPVRALPNVPCRYPELDLVVVRENTESLYAGLEHVVVPGVVESLKIITEKASTRIARFAFEHAKRESRKKVTAVGIAFAGQERARVPHDTLDQRLDLLATDAGVLVPA